MGSYTDTKISKEMIHMRVHIVPHTHKMSSVLLSKKRTPLYGCYPSNNEKFLCALELTVFCKPEFPVILPSSRGIKNATNQGNELSLSY